MSTLRMPAPQLVRKPSEAFLRDLSATCAVAVKGGLSDADEADLYALAKHIASAARSTAILARNAQRGAAGGPGAIPTRILADVLVEALDDALTPEGLRYVQALVREQA